MNFQAAAGDQGRMFDEQCRYVLRDLGCAVSDRPVFLAGAGVEVDAVITTPSGEKVYAEFKGSWRGERPGLLRTDTVKKAIASAWLVSVAPPVAPFVLLTSHLPAIGSSGDTAIGLALSAGIIAGVYCVNAPGDIKALRARLVGDASASLAAS
jgi:hypothetical protein